MKRIALLAVIGAGLLALPASAAAGPNNCPSGPVTMSGGVVTVCVDTGVDGADGGYVQVGPSHAVVDGSDDNLPGPATGYAGLNAGSANESPGPAKDSDCDGEDEAAPSRNSGGCFWIKPLGADGDVLSGNVVTDMFVCGNTSGSYWGGTGGSGTAKRDGCSIP